MNKDKDGSSITGLVIATVIGALFVLFLVYIEEFNTALVALNQRIFSLNSALLEFNAWFLPQTIIVSVYILEGVLFFLLLRLAYLAVASKRRKK